MSGSGYLPKGTRFDLKTGRFIAPPVAPPRPNASSKSASYAVELGGAPLGNNERGIVLSPPIVADGVSIHIKNIQIDPFELRAALLFWDRLDWPENNLIHIEGNAEVQFLVSEGIMTRSVIRASGGVDMAQAYIGATRQAIAALEKRDPDKWTVSKSDRSLTIIGDERSSSEGIIFGLHSAIPLPDKDAPLEEILEFRLRRRAELLALRSALDVLREKIENGLDIEESELLSKANIARTVNDLLNSAKENKFRQIISDTKFSFNWVSAAQKMLLGYEGGKHFGIPMQGAAMGLLGGFSISTGLGSLRDLIPRTSIKSPFEYAVKAHYELPWT